jgi:hypothetical protein
MTSLPFDAIEEEFASRTRRIVWCTVATVDEKGRPRTRILHPIWEGTAGWIATRAPLAQGKAPGGQSSRLTLLLGPPTAERLRGGDGRMGR